MSDQPLAGESGLVFQEIRTGNPERAYRFRSLTALTYAALAAAGLYAVIEIINIVALAGRWSLLAQFAGGGYAASSGLRLALHNSDAFVTTTVIVILAATLFAYVAGGFWVYNAACNLRALGVRGLQNTPGWAVGWFAVPIASLYKPFQVFEELYLASGSPLGWRRLKTPLILRWWWGGWLVYGLAGYAASALTRLDPSVATVIAATQLLMVDAAITVCCSVLYGVIVWRIFRAQIHSESQVNEVAQVFA